MSPSQAGPVPASRSVSVVRELASPECARVRRREGGENELTDVESVAPVHDRPDVEPESRADLVDVLAEQRLADGCLASIVEATAFNVPDPHKHVAGRRRAAPFQSQLQRANERASDEGTDSMSTRTWRSFSRALRMIVSKPIPSPFHRQSARCASQERSPGANRAAVYNNRSLSEYSPKRTTLETGVRVKRMVQYNVLPSQEETWARGHELVRHPTI